MRGSGKSLSELRVKSFCLPEVSNPFVQELKLSTTDKLQVALMSVTVAPLRLILVLILTFITWSLAVLGVACRSQADRSKPLSGWRRCLRKPFIIFLRTIYFVMGFHYVKTKGERAPASVAPLLVAAPHSSPFDILLICVGTQCCSPVSRAENADIFVLGSVLKFLEPVFVQREDPESRTKSVQEIRDRSSSPHHWPQVIIFPEGTCTNRTCLISFKLGAFLPGVPVQPVCITFPNRLDTVTWTWEGLSIYQLLWMTMCQFNTRCEIEYLPVYKPTEAEKAVPRVYADNVREVMAFHLMLPLTDHTFDDCRLMREAQKLHMSPRAGLVEMEKLHSKLGLSFSGVQTLLQEFNKIKSSSSTKAEAACITFDDFRNYLMLPESEALRKVFDLYDRDKSGTIDFREYVIGLSLLSSPVNNNDTLELAFQLFDLDNDGHISLNDLKTILGQAFSVTEEEANSLFTEVNTSCSGRITLDEFKSYAKKKPEYARIFTTYRDLQLRQQKLSEDNSIQTVYSSDFEQWATKVDAGAKKLQ